MRSGIKTVEQAGGGRFPEKCDDGQKMQLLLALMEGSFAPQKVKKMSRPPKLGNDCGALLPPLGASSQKRPNAALVSPQPKRAKLVRLPVLPQQEQLLLQKIRLAPLEAPPTLSFAKLLATRTQNSATDASTENRDTLRQTQPLCSINYNDGPRPATFQISPIAMATGRISHYLTAPSQSTYEIDDSNDLKEAPSQLHSICCWTDHEDLASILSSVLARDGEAVRRPFKLARTSEIEPESIFRSKRASHEPYTLPLNLALLHQPAGTLNLVVLRLLGEKGPDVICMDDNGTSSLLVALRHHPTSVVLAQLLLEINPACVHVADRRGNTPLHIACSSSNDPSLEVVQEIFRLHPAAMDKRNFDGETPWSLLRRKTHLSKSPVGEFLYACSVRRGRRQRKISTNSRCCASKTV